MANCLQLAEEEEAFNKYQRPTPKTPCNNPLNCYDQIHEHIQHSTIYEASQAICSSRNGLLMAG